jgi:hypothetical protein
MNMTDQRPAPPVTPELVDRAARSPGQRIYAVDPFFDEQGEVPPWGIEGAWQVDEHGHLSEPFVSNPKYRPSPVAQGFPQPTDPIDYAIQLAATGYGPETDVRDALLTNAVFVEKPDDDGVLVAEDDDGEFLIVVTSDAQLPTKERPWQRLRLRDVLPLLPPGASLLVNPWSRVKVRVPAADLVVA